MLCPTIRKCHVATVHNSGSVLISVGIFFKGSGRHVVLCIQDPLLGCEHIRTKWVGALIIMERIAQTLREAS